MRSRRRTATWSAATVFWKATATWTEYRITRLDIVDNLSSYGSIIPAVNAADEIALRRFSVIEADDAAVYEKQTPDGDLVSRYRFLESDSYMDMAATYRSYLMERYPELKKNDDTEAPILVSDFCDTSMLSP